MIRKPAEALREKVRRGFRRMREKGRPGFPALAVLVLLTVPAVCFFRFDGDFERKEKELLSLTDGLFSGGEDENRDETREQLTSLEEAQEFRDGKGILSIACTGIREGGVYIFVNGCIEADLRGKDPVTLRVKAGDVILAMGHDLLSEATVTVTAAVGRIDCTVLGRQLSVGNKGKLLAVIRKAESGSQG